MGKQFPSGKGESKRDSQIINRTKKYEFRNEKACIGTKKANVRGTSENRYDNFGRISKKYANKHQAETRPRENKNVETAMKTELNDCEIENSPISESELIKKIFGIEQFDTSKNKDHSGSSLSCVNINSKRKYRQYMNRPGGFNRPLSPTQ
ncbi:U4/U6.U5 small nuclear ribonucleoprotein [Cryptosporidium felis]|nr:U4/U6.U5 small nuclear ribonucleoprotein [Cryptosporidium felis]